jgi:predicted nucleic acid-binding Zn ribbon protein
MLVEYECKKCDNKIEVLERSEPQEPPKCCGKKMEKVLFSLSSIKFVGKWYKTGGY